MGIFLSVVWSEQGWVDVYFGWVSVSGHFLWVNVGRWRYILGRWG